MKAAWLPVAAVVSVLLMGFTLRPAPFSLKGTNTAAADTPTRDALGAPRIAADAAYSVLLLVATVTGQVINATSLTFSISPAGSVGVCTRPTEFLYTCVVERPAVSATTQILTITATGPGGTGVTTQTLVY